MAGRKPGNPEGVEQKPIPISIPRAGDWLDAWEKPAPATITQAAPAPAVPATPPILELQEQALESAPAPAQATVGEGQGSLDEHAATATQDKAAKKTASKKKSAKKPKKERPRRADIGFRQDLEDASAKLRRHVISNGQEDYVTRTDVVAQATCAVARALGSIHCAQVPRRGHYSTPSAAAYDAALQEAFYRGVAHHFIENNLHLLPDRLLRLCYDHYRVKNDMGEE